jgi:hypothetical protein
MEPIALLAQAQRFVDSPSITAGVWARAAALLARQALELEVAVLLRERAAGAEAASVRVQLLCLCEVLGDEDLARRVSFAWWALTCATHVHSYELPPTAEELRSWCAVVAEFLQRRLSRPGMVG